MQTCLGQLPAAHTIIPESLSVDLVSISAASDLTPGVQLEAIAATEACRISDPVGASCTPQDHSPETSARVSGPFSQFCLN